MGPDNEVVGLLAESWEVSEDGLTYTFKLRDGVRFHNGREVTAEDVKWSIERACQPAMASQTADAYLSDVVGLTDMVEGRATSVSGIKVIDEDTISITLKQKTPYFLGRLTYLVSAVVAKEAVPATSAITKKEEMVGTGPFKVERYDDKQLVVLVANDDYWGGAPKLKRIERPVILNAATRLDKFVNGELDVVQIQRADLKAVLDKPDLKDKVKYFPRPAIWYVGMNQSEYAPFKDRRVRQAFAMSIDRDRIVGELMGGVNTPAYTIVPPGVIGHREKGAGLPFDPEGAKKLLAEAGYPNGKGLPALEMTHREGYPDIKLVAEAVAGQIKKNLGVEVRVQPMEWAKYLEVYNAKKQVFFHMRWAADYLDPQNFLSHMLATWGPENKIGYSNPQFDALCRQADTMMDMDARIPLYQKAEDILLQDAVWVPIYFQRDIELHRPGVQDMRESLFGHLPHTTTRLVQ
ncbi:ABC transporter substrate-binding protein [Kamptonema cortianum]|nr:ABC transporter substrate-binding protein [Kamptonema cortianum]